MIEAPAKAEVAAAHIPPSERRQILMAEYGEVCKSHAGITDFRAKLLALLPITSGAGAGILLAQAADHLSATKATALIVLGLFGLVVTFALFFYELRQIDTCKQLRNHAAWLEAQLGIAAGQFGGRRARLSLRDMYSPRARRERDATLTDSERADRTAALSPTNGVVGRPFVGAEAAGYLVYHAVMVAWVLVAIFGAVKL
jgi:hypothetical protein